MTGGRVTVPAEHRQPVRRFKAASREDDLQLLRALHLVDNEGDSMANAARRVGLGRNQLIGLRNRIRTAEAETADHCRRPENLDGGAGPLWWAK